MKIEKILKNKRLSREDIARLLSIKSPETIELLRVKAYETLIENCGEKVFLRGIVEFSNVCSNDCYYCGIRKSAQKVKRYSLDKAEIIEIAKRCAKMGYGSIVVQSGERDDAKFIDFVEDTIRTIKEKTKSDKLPNGLGITLCVGEQSEEAYRRFFEAGAHRYLLRVETSDKRLYESLHPKEMSFENRVKCLKTLKKIGYQVGTGVMIGLPGQTIENLADDVLFFRDMDVDMIGMGPYLLSKNTPLKSYEKKYIRRKDDIYSLSLKMIAVTRLVLKDVNIASTTALQTINSNGRLAGLSFGANVFMPSLTPSESRKEYNLYEDKHKVDDTDKYKGGLSVLETDKIKRPIGYDEWGDSPRFFKKNERK